MEQKELPAEQLGLIGTCVTAFLRESAPIKELLEPLATERRLDSLEQLLRLRSPVLQTDPTPDAHDAGNDEVAFRCRRARFVQACLATLEMDVQGRTLR